MKEIISGEEGAVETAEAAATLNCLLQLQSGGTSVAECKTRRPVTPSPPRNATKPSQWIRETTLKGVEVTKFSLFPKIGEETPIPPTNG